MGGCIHPCQKPPFLDTSMNNTALHPYANVELSREQLWCSKASSFCSIKVKRKCQKWNMMVTSGCMRFLKIQTSLKGCFPWRETPMISTIISNRHFKCVCTYELSHKDIGGQEASLDIGLCWHPWRDGAGLVQLTVKRTTLWLQSSSGQLWYRPHRPHCVTGQGLCKS